MLRTASRCGGPPSWRSSASSPEARTLEVAVPAQRQRLARRSPKAGQRLLAGGHERRITGVPRVDALRPKGRLATVQRELGQDVVLAFVDVEVDAESRVPAVAGVRLTALHRRNVGARRAVVALEILQRHVRAHERDTIPDVERQALAGIARTGAVAVQVPAENGDELQLLRQGEVEEQRAGDRPLVGDALERAQRARLVRAGEGSEERR